MLSNPPPGFNAAPINRQNNQFLGIPGQQGVVSQGYPANLFKSSYSAPSSSMVPSSLPAQNQSYGHPANMMVNALRGGKI